MKALADYKLRDRERRVGRGKRNEGGGEEQK